MKLLSFFKTKTTYIIFSVLISMSSQGIAQIQSSYTGKSDLNSMGIEPMKPREPLNAPPKSSSSSVAPMTRPSAPSLIAWRGILGKGCTNYAGSHLTPLRPHSTGI